MSTGVILGSVSGERTTDYAALGFCGLSDGQLKCRLFHLTGAVRRIMELHRRFPNRGFMLEDYYVKPSTIDRVRSSWLAPQIESYLEWLQAHGYSRLVVYRRLPLLFHFAEFAQKKGLRRCCFLQGLYKGIRIEVVGATRSPCKNSHGTAQTFDRRRVWCAADAAAGLQGASNAQSPASPVPIGISSSGVC